MKTKKEFKIGNTVRIINENEYGHPLGAVGEIVELLNYNPPSAYITYKGKIYAHSIKNLELVDKETNMKTYKVTREQLKEIYDIACHSWKNKIEKVTNEILGAFDNEALLGENFVDEMYAAATQEQLSVIKRIFPKPKKKVTKTIVKYDAFSGKDFIHGCFFNMEDSKEKVEFSSKYNHLAKITVEYEVEED